MKAVASEDRQNSEADSGLQHLPDSRPHFFKIMAASYFQELPIPMEFIRKFRKEFSDVIHVKGPSGKVWCLSLKETDGVVYFVNGWKEFSEHHSLLIGYILIFRYDGNSQFNVQVFDRTACEKEYPRTSTNHGGSCSNIDPCVPEKEGDDDSTKPFGVLDEVCCSYGEKSDDSLEILGVSKVEGRDFHPPKRGDSLKVLRRSLRRRCDFNAMKTKTLHFEISVKDNGKRKKYNREILTQSKRKRSKSGRFAVSENLQQVEQEDNLLISQPGDIQFNVKVSMESMHHNTENCPLEENTQWDLVPMVSQNQNTESCTSSSRETSLINLENHQTDLDNLSSSSDDAVYSKEQEECVMPVDGKVYFRSVRGRRNLIAKEKQDVFLEAKNFVSNNPFFIVVICRSYFHSRQLYIPSNFTKDHLQRRPSYAVLQFLDEQKWPVEICYRKKSSASLTTKWIEFVLKYNIKAGDVCIFELVGRKNMEFKVIIYQNGSVQKSATNKCSTSFMPSPEDTFPLGLKNQQSDLDNLSSSPDDVVYSKEQGECVMSIDGNVYFRSVRGRRNLIPEEKQVAFLEAKNFVSNDPFFIVVMCRSYLHARKLYIPSNFTKDHLQRRPSYAVLQFLDEQKWPVKICYTKKNSASLTTRWTEFVLKYNIKEGDVCIFELVGRENTEFKVIIFQNGSVQKSATNKCSTSCMPSPEDTFPSGQKNQQIDFG